MVLWFTGLSGSGKSTVAGALEQALHAMGVRTYLLDGDNVRHGLCRDLGFSDDDRRENIRRVGEVAKLMVDAGLVVLTAFISPHRAERQMVRDMLDDGQFVEVFVDTPLAICEARDPKGLYKSPRRRAAQFHRHRRGLSGAGGGRYPPEWRTIGNKFGCAIVRRAAWSGYYQTLSSQKRVAVICHALFTLTRRRAC